MFSFLDYTILQAIFSKVLLPYVMFVDRLGLEPSFYDTRTNSCVSLMVGKWHKIDFITALLCLTS